MGDLNDIVSLSQCSIFKGPPEGGGFAPKDG